MLSLVFQDAATYLFDGILSQTINASLNGQSPKPFLPLGLGPFLPRGLEPEELF
jgi:hypothetical protein